MVTMKSKLKTHQKRVGGNVLTRRDQTPERPRCGVSWQDREEGSPSCSASVLGKGTRTRGCSSASLSLLRCPMVDCGVNGVGRWCEVNEGNGQGWLDQK